VLLGGITANVAFASRSSLARASDQSSPLHGFRGARPLSGALGDLRSHLLYSGAADAGDRDSHRTRRRLLTGYQNGAELRSQIAGPRPCDRSRRQPGIGQGAVGPRAERLDIRPVFIRGRDRAAFIGRALRQLLAGPTCRAGGPADRFAERMRAISVHRYRSIVEFTHLNFELRQNRKWLSVSMPNLRTIWAVAQSGSFPREGEHFLRENTSYRFGDVLVHRREVQRKNS